MANILSTITRDEKRIVQKADADGVLHDVEELATLIHSVTFLDSNGAAHTLTFHPRGTEVQGEAENIIRKVGESVPYHEFTDAETAIQAFLDGKL